MPRVPLLLGVLAPAALLGQEGAGAELWRLAATTLAQPPALATGGAAGFWNPAQPATGERAAFGLEVVNTSSAVGASGVLFTARARVSPVGRVGIVYGRMSISDLVPTSLSPDPDGGTIPFYTQTVGASWSATRGFTQDDQFGAGFALGDLFATDLLLVREGSYSGARWRFVAGLGLVIGRYRLTLAENPGVAGVGASYRMGVEALFR